MTITSQVTHRTGTRLIYQKCKGKTNHKNNVGKQKTPTPTLKAQSSKPTSRFSCPDDHHLPQILHSYYPLIVCLIRIIPSLISLHNNIHFLRAWEKKTKTTKH